MQFKKATKTDARLRMALMGISGSGKTMTALQIASALGGKTAVIDTERGSASKYADLYEFDVLELENFSPQHYIDAVQAAEDAGYNNLIIDSLSHEWNGSGGVLELHDKAAKKMSDSFRAWGGITPLHNRVLDKILASRCHIIATMRTKSDYSVSKDERGKTVIQKIGMAPVQKDNVEYEFDVVGSLNQENTLSIEKTRCIALAGRSFQKSESKTVAEILKNWLTVDGSAMAADGHASSKDLITNIHQLLADLNTSGDTPQWKSSNLQEFLSFNYSSQTLEDLGYEKLEKVHKYFADRLSDLTKSLPAAA